MRNLTLDWRPGEIPSNGLSQCASLTAWLLRELGPLKVIEIGTAYGRQLKSFVPLSLQTICIDPMYNWVPDVVGPIDRSLIDAGKVTEWRANVESFSDKVKLVIDTSTSAAQDPNNGFEDCDILIIDGCHHPPDAVRDDYWNFKKFMRDPHYVVWDDADEGDVSSALDRTKKELEEAGFAVWTAKVWSVVLMFVRRQSSSG